MVTTVLEQDVYGEAEAAHLLGVPTSTLHYWLQGGAQRGATYQPILRPERRETRYVTWAEFIEAGWLRAYRSNKVPMRELRRFIELLRDELGVPYPLAHRQPLVTGKRLVFEAQRDAQLDTQWQLVDSQLVLTYPGQTFMERITWEGDLAVGWRPVDDPRSTVVVRPDVRFGRPSVAGVSTAALYDYAEEGASTSEISENFSITQADVRWALAFENARHAA